MRKKDKGWVYVISNAGMPGLVKVGVTKRTPEIRAQDMATSSNLPFDFEVKFKIYTYDPWLVESRAHSVLKERGRHFKKEWFSCTDVEAAKVIKIFAYPLDGSYEEPLPTSGEDQIPASPEGSVLSFKVGDMLLATKGSRNEVRDYCILLLMYRHGLRVSELCRLRLSQIDLEERVLHVVRLKRGLATTHPLREGEVLALSQWLSMRSEMGCESDSLFVSERRKPMNRRTVWHLVKRYGESAGLDFTAHPHMLRHACGYELASQGATIQQIQGYLGHRNIKHSEKYTTRQAKFRTCETASESWQGCM